MDCRDPPVEQGDDRGHGEISRPTNTGREIGLCPSDLATSGLQCLTRLSVPMIVGPLQQAGRQLEVSSDLI